MTIYSVDSCHDDHTLLRDRLQQIAQTGGKVISVTWQPARMITLDDKSHPAQSGFTIVSKREEAKDQ